jgi:hypothetical protein
VTGGPLRPSWRVGTGAAAGFSAGLSAAGVSAAETEWATIVGAAASATGTVRVDFRKLRREG